MAKYAFDEREFFALARLQGLQAALEPYFEHRINLKVKHPVPRTMLVPYYNLLKVHLQTILKLPPGALHLRLSPRALYVGAQHCKQFSVECALFSKNEKRISGCLIHSTSDALGLGGAMRPSTGASSRLAGSALHWTPTPIEHYANGDHVHPTPAYEAAGRYNCAEIAYHFMMRAP